MKSILFILLLTITITIFSSCKKDKIVLDVNASTAATYPDYGQLKVGNYWIYQQFEIDRDGNSTPLNVYDSCYIEKDTVINGKLYYKMFRQHSEPHLSKSFLRDSLHYIVNSSGRIIFTPNDLNTIFHTHYYITSYGDTIGKSEIQMADKDLTVIVDAGVFITNASKITHTLYTPTGHPDNIRHQYTRYAKDIGIVVETLQIYTSNPNSKERRLVRYHLN